MRILYLCSVPGFQVANDISCLTKLKHEVVVADTSKNPRSNVEMLNGRSPLFNIYQTKDARSLTGLVHSAFFPYSKLLIPAASHSRQSLVGTLIENRTDLVFASWDSSALVESRFLLNGLRSAGLKVPVVFRFLMYPANVTTPMIRLEHRLLRKTFTDFDGRIWPTEIMRGYCSENLCADFSGARDIVLPFLPSVDYFPRRRNPLLSLNDCEPHIVYVGSTDFRNPLRNISDVIREITDNRIHLHMSKITPDRLARRMAHENPYLHVFDPVQMENLAHFMTSFDGCLICYNYTARSRIDRLQNGIPNQMFWGIASGVPVFVYSPKGELAACENLVRDLGIGENVKSVSDLGGILADKTGMHRLQQTVLSELDDHCYERYLPGLGEFLAGI